MERWFEQAGEISRHKATEGMTRQAAVLGQPGIRAGVRREEVVDNHRQRRH